MKKTLIFASCLITAVVHADSIAWIGNTGYCDWSVSTNWNGGTVPSGDATVVFGCDYGAYSQKIMFRMTPPAEFTGTIVTTNDFAVLAGTQPTYLELSVVDGAAWSVSGCGTVIATGGIEDRIAAQFSGTVDVPSGVTFTVPAGLSSEVCFTGAGTLVLDSVDRMEKATGFSGVVTLPPDAELSASDTSVFRTPTMSLGDGAKLSFGKKTLAWGAIKEMPDWNVPGAWSFNADNSRLEAADSPIELDSRPPFVTPEGDLRLVNDPAQSHSAFLTNRMFSVTDDWGVDFTFVPELPSDSKFVQAGKGQEMEGYFGFYLQSVSPVNVGQHVHCPVPSGYGTAIYLYRAGSQHVGWHFNASAAMLLGSSVKERELDGIMLNRPMDYSVTCIDGMLTVTIRQEGKSFSMRKSLKEGFLDGRPKGVYIGFGGACSWWNENRYPWTRMTVRGFKGWYRSKDEGAWEDAYADIYPFSTDRWVLSCYNNTDKVKETATVNSDGSFDLIPKTYQKTTTASCMLPLSASKRYRIDVDVRFAEKNKDLCEGISLALGKRKPVTTHYVFNHTSGWAFDQWAYSVGLKHWLYGNGYVKPYLDLVSGGTRYQDEVQHSGFFPLSAQKRMKYSLRYDPSGDIEWRLSSTQLNGDLNDGTVSVLRHVFNADKMGKFLAQKGEGSGTADDMYLLMSGASASWAALETAADGVSVKELKDNNAPKIGKISVPDGASATLAAEAEFPRSATPALVLSGAVLGSGSALAFDTEGEAASISVDAVSVNGRASMSAASGVTVRCSRFDYGAGGGLLTLNGSFSLGDGLVVTVPDAWRRQKGEKTLLDLSAAVLEGGMPSEVTVLGEDGTDRTGMCSLVQRDGVLAIVPRGMVMIVK